MEANVVTDMTNRAPAIINSLRGPGMFAVVVWILNELLFVAKLSVLLEMSGINHKNVFTSLLL
jgi:hypothetical protein